jgi:pilus assembly protein Flp/PilA
MLKFWNTAVDFINNEDGPTAVEYAVLLALIIIVCITSLVILGGTTNTNFVKATRSFGS